jgi:hypothetical protein
MIKELIKIANRLDYLGLKKEANIIDSIIKSSSDGAAPKPGTENTGRGRLEAFQKLMSLSSELSRAPDVQVSAVGNILNSLGRILAGANTNIPGFESARKDTSYEKQSLLSYLEKIK